MRQLYLVNEVGTTYFLDYRTDTYISDIGDIGFERNNVFMEYEHNYKKIDEKFVKKNIVLQLVFTKGYEGYSSFINFVNTSNELRLFYLVNGDKKYCDISFKSITKKELHSEVIQSTLTLEQLSRWKTKQSFSLVSEEPDEGKKYAYSYPYKYAGSYKGSTFIEVKGDYTSSIGITITGAMNNPSLVFYKDNKVVATFKIYVSTNQGVLSASSIETSPYIILLNEGVEENIYHLQDFDSDNFIYLKKGKYRVDFDPGVAKRVACNILVYDTYGGQ